jgi:hypothetical protein
MDAENQVTSIEGIGAAVKTPPHVDDADVDEFVTTFLTKLNPALSAEERADTIRDFVLGYVKLAQPDASKEWANEFAYGSSLQADLLPPSFPWGEAGIRLPPAGCDVCSENDGTSDLIDELQIQMVASVGGRRPQTPSKSLKRLVLQEYFCGCGGSQPSELDLFGRLRRRESYA